MSASEGKRTGLLLVLILLAGCQSTPQLERKNVNMEQVTIEDVRNDVPAFERNYHTRINADVTMKINIKWYWDGGGLYTSGELDQTGGRWVLFEPERPADKILDREILPIVQKRCNEILMADHAFRDSNPREFVDKQGRSWVRK